MNYCYILTDGDGIFMSVYADINAAMEEANLYLPEDTHIDFYIATEDTLIEKSFNSDRYTEFRKLIKELESFEETLSFIHICYHEGIYNSSTLAHAKYKILKKEIFKRGN